MPPLTFRALMRTPLLIGLATAACTGPAPNPPSLMARPIEKLSLEEPAVGLVVRTPLPTVTLGRADALVARIRASVDATARATPAARPAAQRGSDAWIDATTTASAAQVALIAARDALAELDRLVADTTTTGHDAAALVRSRDGAAATIARAQAALDAVTPR